MVRKIIKHIHLTKHSKDKIILLTAHGFNLHEEFIIEAIRNSDKVLPKDNQKLLLKIYDENHALQLVCEEIEKHNKSYHYLSCKKETLWNIIFLMNQRQM